MDIVEGRSVASRRPRAVERVDDGEAHPDRASPRTGIDGARSSLAETPGSRDFIALLKAFRGSGGTAPGDIFGPVFAQRRSEGAPTLKTLVASGHVFGFEWSKDFWIPLFQFDADDHLSVRASVREVRSELPATWSGWRLATWFAEPQAILGDRCPVDVLDACTADAIRAARCHRSPTGIESPAIA